MTDIKSSVTGTLTVSGAHYSTTGLSRKPLTIGDVLEFCQEALDRGATLDSSLTLRGSTDNAITVELPAALTVEYRPASALSSVPDDDSPRKTRPWSRSTGAM